MAPILDGKEEKENKIIVNLAEFFDDDFEETEDLKKGAENSKEYGTTGGLL